VERESSGAKVDPDGSVLILKSERSNASPSTHKYIHVRMKKDQPSRVYLFKAKELFIKIRHKIDI
jgi:hypothetical protein